MLDRLAPLAHFFRVLVEPALDGFEKLPAHSAIQTDGRFLGWSFRSKNCRQGYRHKSLLARLASSTSEVAP
jgi:hypothetical protein